MKKIIIGVMGPGEGATDRDLTVAYELGRAIALDGWVVLTGGRNTGVMDAACRGAKSAHGLTIGILPTNHSNDISAAVDIPILTGMGNARNNINVLSSDGVVACGLGAGTVSEIALALKAHKPVVLLNQSEESQMFFRHLAADAVWIAHCPEAARGILRQILDVPKHRK
ncbi:MAG: TIGR00725 family protein [Scytolyngbya sp. HA4215-MV1]|jgi:hypothetical protein|nr:TIGR00725 family protein [Scytolyngbya sp. HA4215-MV1]